MSVAVAGLAKDFLAQRRIAVVGVSGDGAGHGANAVYLRLRERGYAVFAVNPNAKTVEGDPSYPDLRSIPDGVDAVVIGTAPQRAEAIVRDCYASTPEPYRRGSETASRGRCFGARSHPRSPRAAALRRRCRPAPSG